MLSVSPVLVSFSMSAAMAEIAWHRSRIANLEQMIQENTVSEPPALEPPAMAPETNPDAELRGPWFRGKGRPFARGGSWSEIGKGKKLADSSANIEINRKRRDYGIARNSLSIHGEVCRNTGEWISTFARLNPGVELTIRELFDLSPYGANGSHTSFFQFRAIFVGSRGWARTKKNGYFRTKNANK
jgi:hypothetical protein